MMPVFGNIALSGDHEQPAESFKCQHCNAFRNWVISYWNGTSLPLCLLALFLLWIFVCNRADTCMTDTHRKEERSVILWQVGRTFWSVLWACSCWKSKVWGLTSHALCVSVGKSHVSTSAGPKKLAPLWSLLVLWVRQAAELQLCGGGL